MLEWGRGGGFPLPLLLNPAPRHLVSPPLASQAAILWTPSTAPPPQDGWQEGVVSLCPQNGGLSQRLAAAMLELKMATN
jgi:hypothetical protein